MKDYDVSDEILLNDLNVTEKEVEAYRMLSEGNAILARLWGNSQPMFKINAMRYDSMLSDCRSLLGKLNKIKTERGL